MFGLRKTVLSGQYLIQSAGASAEGATPTPGDNVCSLFRFWFGGDSGRKGNEGTVRHVGMSVEVHCGNCGAKMEASAKVCPSCGSSGSRYTANGLDSGDGSGGEQGNPVSRLRRALRSLSERARNAGSRRSH